MLRTNKMSSSIGEEFPSTAKRPRIENGQFVAAWKTEFPWVTYSHAEGMHSQYYIDTGKKNDFTKGCDKYKML